MSQSWKGWTLYSVAWLPLLIGYGSILTRMRDVPMAEAWLSAANYAVSAALLGVFVWKLSGRLQWPERKFVPFVLLQVLLGLVYSSLWLGAIVLYLTARVGLTNALQISATFAWWQLLSGMWVYGLLAGVSYALRVTGRLREREAAAARADAQRMRAELNALRGQLNPHFLFNTLHTLSALVSQDPAVAQNAVERLADLLRYVLDAKRFEREEVTLAEELVFVRDYLGLEQLRFAERLSVVEDIDDDALDLMIPSLTLQPLVENAIKHGIEPRAGGGTMSIRASVSDDVLTLHISDDGPGAIAETVNTARGVGLRAVRQRIATRYGARGSFAIATSLGKGFSITITLPARVAQNVTAEMLAVHA